MPSTPPTLPLHTPSRGEPGLRARSPAPCPGLFPPRGYREGGGLDWPPDRCGLQSWGHNYTTAGSCLTSVSLFPSVKWEPSAQSHTRFAFTEGWRGASHC